VTPVSETRSLTRHGQDRKAELLHHAEQLFAQRGYEDTRMIDIADAAGVAKGLVYWYFENKETLFYEIVVDMGRRLRRAQRQAVEGIEDPLGRLYVGTAESVRFIAEHHRLYGLITMQIQGDRRLRETQFQSRRLLADDVTTLIAEGQELGQIRIDDDPAALAYTNAGVVYYHVLLYAEGLVDPRKRRDIDHLAHGAARYVVRAVGADAAAIDGVLARFDPATIATADRN
jgi:AcrR family transcriptional regulator